MQAHRRFYIGGRWVEAAAPRDYPLTNPATGERVGSIVLGGAADVDRAVAAARQAFPAFAASSVAERRELLAAIAQRCERRREDLARAISAELGAPIGFARRAQARLAAGHMQAMVEVLARYPFTEDRGRLRLQREPIGVCGLITPWNWPLNQIACKVAPALGAGCTMVLKPSELAPLSALVFAEILHEAGVPPGVFNLVQGDGADTGQALAAHEGIDMVSFTGSTRGGIAVARAAADTVKRVHQELGGKSPNIILDEGVLGRAVSWGVRECFQNSGQSCNAPTRMLVPRALHDQAVALACEAAAALRTGDPADPATDLGPVISRNQYERIQRLIQSGIDEGARLALGGTGHPPGLDRGFYVRPTIFAGVDAGMTIAREEIFGPVLAIMPYGDEAQALHIANDSRYGLAAYVSGSDPAQVRRVGGQLRAGMVHLNEAPMNLHAPFGGYRQSGNGREWGEFGLEAFLELKAMPGWGQA
ncbi:MAG: aldehyde dehydrogenase family protein [Acetobacteraceae bacterium]|nr:aldehyde dehydrogenase family protein [Acetobacteraceae bacterium]